MIKEVLQQLEPLDAQIDALCSSTDDAEMANTTTHAAELAELSAQENMLLQRCTSLTPEDRVFLARRPDRPHIGEIIDNLFTDFFEQCGAHEFTVDAPWLERILAGTNVEDYESLQYFQTQLGDSGILDELVRQNVEEDDTIKIGEYEFDYVY